MASTPKPSLTAHVKRDIASRHGAISVESFMRDGGPATDIHSAQCTVMMTVDQHRRLKTEAENFGYSLSGLIRMRMFNQVQGMRALRKTRFEVAMLGKALCQLTALTGVLHQNQTTLVSIAQQLTSPQRDLFGLESSVQLAQSTQKKILHALLILEAAIVQAYYSVVLDSPLFPAPVNAALFPDQDTGIFNLVWNRSEPQGLKSTTVMVAPDVIGKSTATSSPHGRRAHT